MTGCFIGVTGHFKLIVTGDFKLIVTGFWLNFETTSGLRGGSAIGVGLAKVI